MEYDAQEQYDLDDPNGRARSRHSHTAAAHTRISHRRTASTSTDTNTTANTAAGTSSGDAMAMAMAMADEHEHESGSEHDDQAAWTSPSRSSGVSIAIAKQRIPKSHRQGSPAGMPKPVPRPVLRTAVPGDGLALRHPTPVDDQQVRLASYTGKIQHLERTAEQLSMTSSSSTPMQDAIRELHGELKRNDLLRSPLQTLSPDPTIETHDNAAPLREITLPQDSSHAPDGLARSASKSSRFGSRREPELEGRPLDAYVKTSQSATATAQEGDHLLTMTPPPEDHEVAHKLQVRNPEPQHDDEDVPSTPASTDTFDPEKAFAGFDGAHGTPPLITMPGTDPADALDIAQRRASAAALLTGGGMAASTQRATKDRLSVAGNPTQRPQRMSMGRSQSYDDPQTGQQMVYYPAPVPVMLNLPQRLSRGPSSMARTKRRSEALDAIPPIARQTAIWLPDVLEIEDEPNLPETDEAQRLEYIPQHQRMSMGGRRVAQDIQHLPPQLRASAFFDQPAPGQVVQVREQSAVATLDSILDASAHAPVTAFTDHVFAGPLGPEVYGKPKAQNRGSTANLLSPEEKAPKKRSSAFNLLGRRASGGNVLESDAEKRRAMIADIRAGKIIREDDEEEEEDAVSETQEEPEEDYDYHGAPTTLLAELQLRKQQQKHRTRPLTTAYPNGLHSTLLELDAVAQVEANTRKQKRVTLAWEEPSAEEPEDGQENDDDVPLAYLYAKKAQALDLNRPLGLLERRNVEDTEPLSRRRDRLQGKVPKLSRTSVLSLNQPPPEETGETLAQRLSQLSGDGEAATDLPKARPVSGDFASEMMSQFGGELNEAEAKGKESPANEEEETLGQRRKRLQAEAQARAAEVGPPGPPREPPSRPELTKRHSMADILQHHPQAGASRMTFQPKTPTGLLGMHDRNAPRSSGMLEVTSRAPVGGFKGGMYNDGQAGAAPRQRHVPPNPYNTASMHPFPQPSLGFAGGFGSPFYNPGVYNPGVYNPGVYNPGAAMPMTYLPQMHNAMAGMQSTMAGMLQMGVQPLNQGQIDMVERWRQSVMQ